MPIEVSRAAVKALPDAEFVTIPDAAHGFGDANREEAMRRIIGFLAWNGGLEGGLNRAADSDNGRRSPLSDGAGSRVAGVAELAAWAHTRLWA